jgi:tRNA G46 methylase TrmB
MQSQRQASAANAHFLAILWCQNKLAIIIEIIMSESTHTLYDEVLYPSRLYRQTHPDRLATVATMFGMNPAPVENCRVLELGCNDGTNLIAMAYALPRSQFVGIDVAHRPIAAALPDRK